MTAAQAIRLLGGDRAEALALEAEARVECVLDELRRAWARMRRPFRARDARRAVARLTDPAYRVAAAATSGLYGSYHFWSRYELRDIASAIDRVITRLGPDYPLDQWVEEALADRALAEMAARAAEQLLHEQVRWPQSDGAAMVHAVVASTVRHSARRSGGEDPQDDRTPDGPSAQDAQPGDYAEECGAQGGPAPDAAAREGAGLPTGQGDHGADEATGEMGAHPDGRRWAADDQRAGHPRSATGCTAAPSGTPMVGQQHPAGEAEAPGRLALARYLRPGDPIRRAAAERRAARECAEILRRIIYAAVGIGGDASPRVDGRALVRELVSRRMAIGRARRHEIQIRHLVIAVDESGSCAETVQATYGLAVQIAETLPVGCVSVVRHCNGRALLPADRCAPAIRRILAAHRRGLAAHYYSARHTEAAMACWEEIARQDIGLVLHIGDTDALDVCRLLARRVPILSLERSDPQSPDESWRVGPVIDHVSGAARLRRGARPSAPHNTQARRSR